MEKAHFNSLDLNGRMDLVNQKGEYISRIGYKAIWFTLFVVESQLVEVVYNSHVNEIEAIEIIESSDPSLEFYTRPISLKNLIIDSF